MSAKNLVTASKQHLPGANLNITVLTRASMIARYALGLVYLMLVRVLNGLALLARSDAAKDAEILTRFG